MCVCERERQKYVPVGTSGSVVTHGEVSVPPRGPRQLWPLLPHNRVGEHQRQLLLLLWISTQAQEDKEGLEQNPVSKYVLYNIEPRSCYRDTNNVRGVMLERPTELLVGTQSLPIDRPRSRFPTQNPVSKYVLYNIEPRSCRCMYLWNRQRADFRVFLRNRAMVKWRFPVRH